MLTDKELDNFVAADRKEVTAEPSIVVTVDCDWGSDGPPMMATLKRTGVREWVNHFIRPTRPIRNPWVDVLVDIEAAKAARPAIGKPLSRRARRRNRGRVSAAKVALARVYHEPVTWAWPAPGGVHG